MGDKEGATPTQQPAEVKGVTYWVDELNGSDANDGLTPETAFATNRHATEMAGKNYCKPVQVTLD